MPATQQRTATNRELEETIQKAIERVKGSKENDICKYLPSDGGGYVHHFTMRKMKVEDPRKLRSMIEKNILTQDPKRVNPKPRKPRGSRKRQDLIALTHRELDRVLHYLRDAKEYSLISKLSPRRSLTQLKRQLISSIRKGDVEFDLWNAYVDTVYSQNPPADQE